MAWIWRLVLVRITSPECIIPSAPYSLERTKYMPSIGPAEIAIILGTGCLCLIGIAALIGGGLWFARRQQHDKATDEEITSDE